jgi:hypothetical protein
MICVFNKRRVIQGWLNPTRLRAMMRQHGLTISLTEFAAPTVPFTSAFGSISEVMGGNSATPTIRARSCSRSTGASDSVGLSGHFKQEAAGVGGPWLAPFHSTE